MKTCPFCAEEIQDAAIVCKHCGRDLVAAKTPHVLKVRQADWVSTTAKWGVGVLLAWLFAGLLFSTWYSPITEPGSRPNTSQELRITGGRGASGLSLTNIGAEPIYSCFIRLIDDATGSWMAIVDERRTIGLGAEYKFPNRVQSLNLNNAEGDPLLIRPIAEAETVDVPWSIFTAKGQRMPSYIGQNSKSFRVSCSVDDEWRSTVLSF